MKNNATLPWIVEFPQSSITLHYIIQFLVQHPTDFKRVLARKILTDFQYT